MKSKVNISLSLKVTTIIIILSSVSVFSVLYINIEGLDFIVDLESLEETFADSYYQESRAILQGLNNLIEQSEKFENKDFVQQKITELVNNSYDDINKIEELTVNKYDNQSEKLIVYASSKDENIGKESKPYYIGGEYCNKQAYDEDHVFYIIEENKEDKHILITIFPINLTEEIKGTYELVISLDAAYSRLSNKISGLILITFIIVFASTLISLYLLRKIIVKPLWTFKEKARVIGKGTLDTKVNLSSKDEIGELANAFNKMAKDLKESRDKVEEYNLILKNLLNQKDEFIGQLGHDLKNPLQPLVGLLPMLIEQEKDSNIKDALQVMNKNVEYMRDLIFDTLKLAKLRSANIKLDFEDINLREESKKVIGTQELYLRENNVKIENRIDKSIIVEADKLRLAEVLKNLITNSVKYAPDKNGKIIIDAEQEEDMVTVSIKDNGIGMTKEELKKVFDEFYKADRQTSDYYSTGLGLAICKRIVEKHGGKIWVDSEGSGKGTAFYFTLKNKTKNN